MSDVHFNNTAWHQRHSLYTFFISYAAATSCNVNDPSDKEQCHWAADLSTTSNSSWPCDRAISNQRHCTTIILLGCCCNQPHDTDSLLESTRYEIRNHSYIVPICSVSSKCILVFCLYCKVENCLCHPIFTPLYQPSSWCNHGATIEIGFRQWRKYWLRRRFTSDITGCAVAQALY